MNTFIIAELSANHNGSLDIALETVKAAKRAGADAIKIQTYTADTLTLDCNKDDFKIQGTIWQGTTLYDLYQQAYTPWQWHQEIFAAAQKEGLICFSTPFDRTSIDFLEKLNNPIYKIASFEITDHALIRYAASKGKPMILSTGIATEEEIEEAVDICRQEQNFDITLLQCTSAYPAPILKAGLCRIPLLKEKFNVKVGLSDHTNGTLAPSIAVSLGAQVIEKHFIKDHSIGGPDASFSLDEKEFAQMVHAIRDTEKMIQPTPLAPEIDPTSRAFARSLYIYKDVVAGEKISADNIKSIRPGYGLHPRHLDTVLGKRFKVKKERGDRLQWEDIED